MVMKHFAMSCDWSNEGPIVLAFYQIAGLLGSNASLFQKYSVKTANKLGKNTTRDESKYKYIKVNKSK